MLHKYTNIDNEKIFKLSFQINNFNTFGLSYRSSKFYPPAFIKAIQENHNSIEDPVESFSDNYPYYVKINELQDLYPHLSNLSVQVNPVSALIAEIQNLNTEYSYPDSLLNPLPIAVRYTDNSKIWLIERPPFKANFTYKVGRASSHSKTVHQSAWMPWTQMLIYADPKMSEYRPFLFFSDAPISSLDDLALPCFFFNMYNDGSMCLANSYTMLQQHLATLNSFDINSIYNFILNDYMTGGWNSDLSLNVFDSLVNHSMTASSIRNSCIYGNTTKGIKSSTTPTGRISFPKYYNNFFSYFNSLTLDEVNQTIHDIKQDLSNSKSRNLSTFRSLIERVQNSKASPTSLFDIGNYSSSSFTLNSIGFVHPQSVNKINESSDSLLFDKFYDYINSTYTSKISNVTSSEHVYEQIELLNKDSFYYYINENLDLIICDSSFDYSSILSSKSKV